MEHSPTENRNKEKSKENRETGRRTTGLEE